MGFYLTSVSGGHEEEALFLTLRSNSALITMAVSINLSVPENKDVIMFAK
jgi:hypothetical protein